MPDPREITDVAIDSALHGLPEPTNGWRNHLPPEDLGQMVDAGSGQITLQAIVALLAYGKPGDRARAVRTLTRYAELCWTRFMLSEPWSAIYAEAIVLCWVATVILSDRIGEPELARRFRDLLRAWAATSRLMEARAVDGKVYVMAAGCRSWGHVYEGNGPTSLWRIASGRVTPPQRGSMKYGTPGSYDGYGWLKRAAHLGLAELRAAASAYPAEMPIETLLAAAPRWAARTEMQLLGWADGSRLWLMGDDEPAYDDEDENGNTPGWLAAGVLGGRIIVLPRWPNPIDGLERLRQVNCRADLDGSPERGWTLHHSHLGERPGKHPATGAPGFLSSIPPYTVSRLLFHIAITAGDRNWRRLYPAGAPDLDDTHDAPPAPPLEPPHPTPPTPPPAAGTLNVRLAPLDGGRYLLLVERPAGREVVVRKIHPDESRPGEDRYVIEAGA